ncbi:MAG: hypothetical protein LBQ08_01755 [Holosporaceae bacterium]|jgi:hypothetical protein|nr:hypothetical protein [Holosporaceae bacterium]
MNEINFAKFVLVFLLGMLTGNVLNLISRFLKTKNQHNNKKEPSNLPEEIVMSPEKNDFPILSKMRYFLASNDDATGRTYSATPLQDSNPKDMA